jgi:ABC-type transport system substrate-binding protein
MVGMRRPPLVLALGVALVVQGAAAVKTPGRNGGTFRIATASIDSIDPAISVYAWPELGATCAQLMSYEDKPLPAGLRLVPEVAAAYPKVSRDGKTYTFTIRRGFRFNTGENVTAASFAHQINRVLDPATRSSWTAYVQDIVGAQAVSDGKASSASGVQARGNKLVIHLTDEARDFPARTTVPMFCAVPRGLPSGAEAVGSSLPGAGAYYIADYVPGRKLVLKRNRFYHGNRPHHVDSFATKFVDGAQTALQDVEAGRADWTDEGTASDYVGLLGKYKLNKSQLHRSPALLTRLIVLNTSRPLFRGNVKLRQAINFAIDRPALLRARGANTGTLTDQYLPPTTPGFQDRAIYPLHGPRLAKARALARGHLRSGHAVLYIKDTDTDATQAQIVQNDLKAIGVDVAVQRFPGPALFQKLFTADEPFDMTFLGFGPDYFDPYAFLNILLDGRQIGQPTSFNIAHFDSTRYNRLFLQASRLAGAARYRAYGRLDINLVRNAAPLVAYANESEYSFVSKRANCLIFHPSLDLTAVCLK